VEKLRKIKLKKSKDIAKIFNCSTTIVRRWASNHGVCFVGDGMRKDYLFTEEDIERFKNRPPRGRPRLGK
jgi:hypothetical protein